MQNLSELSPPGEADDALMAFQHRLCISGDDDRLDALDPGRESRFFSFWMSFKSFALIKSWQFFGGQHLFKGSPNQPATSKGASKGESKEASMHASQRAPSHGKSR